jgi:hypothetical protein
MYIIFSAGHALPAEFGPEPTEGSHKSHASPVLPHPGHLVPSLLTTCQTTCPVKVWHMRVLFVVVVVVCCCYMSIFCVVLVLRSCCGYISQNTAIRSQNNKTEKSFSNLAASQFCFSRSNKSSTTILFFARLRDCCIARLRDC